MRFSSSYDLSSVIPTSKSAFREEAYQTLLKPRTVLVEPTDYHDNDIHGRSNHL